MKIGLGPLVERARALSRAAPHLGPRVSGGAAWGLAAGTSAILAIAAFELATGWSSAITLAVGLPLGIAVAIAAGAVVLVAVRLLAALPARFRVVLSGCFFVLFFDYFPGPPTERAIATIAVIVPAAAAGAAIALLFRWRSLRAPMKAAAIGGLSAAALAAVIGVRWLLAPGEDDPPAIDASARTIVPVRELDLPDPSRPGDARVRRIFYGSGEDRRRPEYGAGVDLRTRPVDGRPFLRGWSGLEGSARKRFWGFDARTLPIDGRLWIPEGEGPFPIVLVVHGSHPMEEPSEPGYDYLGEHLASHGFLVALVDEDFLNNAPWSIVGGGWLVGENAARGWLLLEHLAAFRRWNGEAGGPLHGKVDLDRVALIGHSKGGEAIAVAAAMNHLPAYPDDATIHFAYGFGIRALVALSGTDSQYLLGGAPTTFADLDYLALQGSDDGDVRSFPATAQLERVALGGSHFKAAVYVHHANHGQWNSVWGRHDDPRLPRLWWFNTRPILPAAAQEQVAKAYTTAFLDASLLGDRRYLPFLEDHRAGRRWLPETIYLARFESAKDQWLARFDEDLDVTTATVHGSRIAGEHLTVWREQPIEPAPTRARAVVLGWDTAKAGVATYTVSLPQGAVEVDPRGSLVLAMADLFTPGGTPGPPGGAREPIDLTIEIADGAGHVARLPLGSACLVQPALQAKLWKGLSGAQPRSDFVFQTFDLPLAGFAAQEPALDMTALASIRLVFDRTRAGLLAVREIGIAPPAS